MNATSKVEAAALTQTESEKGEYSFVIDNFAIIIRYLLEPLEENCYILFTSLKNSVAKNSNETSAHHEQAQNTDDFSNLAR